MQLEPIGVVRSPVTEPVDEGWGEVVSEIHLQDRLAPDCWGWTGSPTCWCCS